MFKGGNLIPYFLFMEQKYGRDTINRLRAANNETAKYTADDYKRIETLYKAKFAKVDQ
jgi:fructose-1,6-bisphosphatase